MADFAQALAETNKKYMEGFNTRNPALVAELFTPDCRLMAPNKPMTQDTSRVQNFVKSLVEKGLSKLTLKSEESWGPMGEMGGERVSAAFDTEDGKRKYDMKALRIWKRVDGKWKIHADCWNFDHAEAKA